MTDRELIQHVLIEVLEQMAMVFADPLDSPAVEGDLLTAVVTFTGPSKGRLRISADSEALHEIAGGVLGLDPTEEGADTAMADVLCELVNVALGNILPRLAGEEKVFDLSAPTLVPAEVARPEDTTVAVSVEGGTLVASFHHEENA